MSRERPNILLIMSDQHHAGIMGCAGDWVVQTPTLDRLASRGVRFSSAYCSFPLCGPSRMSFMTCRHPHENGLWTNEEELSSAIPTFAHAFLAGGYDTVLSGRMHFVGWDQRHGFAERLVGDVPPTVYLSDGWKLDGILGELKGTGGMNLNGILKSGPGRSAYHAYDETVTRATVDWLKKRGKADQPAPFLLTVGYVSPHCPFVAPPEDFERYAGAIAEADLPSPSANLHPSNAERRKRFQTDPPPPRDAQWRARVAYYGLCSFVDRQVAAVLGALEASGLADHTLVVYTSDHGEMLGEHGMWWKSTFYDGASRVPLLLSYPVGFKGEGRVDRNVSLMDLGVTLLDLCGIEPLPGASGRSFRPLLSGQDEGWDDTVFAEFASPGETTCGRMVRSGPWKYNYHHGDRPELFNLQEDPGERNDLSRDAGHQEICRRLHDLALKDWDPERVMRHMNRCAAERRLIGNWVRRTRPAEPDPLWFESVPENRVDTGRRWKPGAPPRGDG